MLMIASMQSIPCLHWLISVHLWLQTALLSVSVGTTCTFYQPLIVLEALALTAAIVVALTVYTFNAARKGANFRYGLRSVVPMSCLIPVPFASSASYTFQH